MSAETIYLDHNATSPLSPAAAEAMLAAWRDAYANPASQHSPGRAARRRLVAARDEVVELLGGEAGGRAPDRLVLTSGGSEANTLALRGLLATSGKRRMVVSAIEHPSVGATADALAAEGFEVDRLGVDVDGVVIEQQLAELLDRHAGEIGLVSVMAASNETGVVQPIQRLARRCREAGVWLHSDATQLVGKHPLRFREVGLAAATFAAHKFNGPLGVGGLLLAPGVTPAATTLGGHQQGGLRAGTEGAPLAVGMATALREWREQRAERLDRLRLLRDRLEERLVATWPGAVVVGARSTRLEHTTCLAFPGADRQALAMAYDLAGVACSTGSACASGSSEPSPTLLAMGLPREIVESAVRFSLGATTTPDQIDDAVERMAGVNRKLLAAAQRRD